MRRLAVLLSLAALTAHAQTRQPWSDQAGARGSAFSVGRVLSDPAPRRVQ